MVLQERDWKPLPINNSHQMQMLGIKIQNIITVDLND